MHDAFERPHQIEAGIGIRGAGKVHAGKLHLVCDSVAARKVPRLLDLFRDKRDALDMTVQDAGQPDRAASHATACIQDMVLGGDLRVGGKDFVHFE